MDIDSLRKEFDGLEGVELIRAAHDKFGDKLALTSSFGADAILMLSLVAQVDKGIPVLFIDTEKHFPITLEYVEAISQNLGLTNVHWVKPDGQEVALRDPEGDLWSTDPDACCHLRKVEPLANHFNQEQFKATIGGRMRWQAPERATLQTVEWDGAKNVVSFNPIALWSKEKAKEEKEKLREVLPPHPLTTITAAGGRRYHSIGCQPCTVPTAEGEDPRKGRWAHTARNGAQKSTCNINFTDGAGI